MAVPRVIEVRFRDRWDPLLGHLEARGEMDGWPSELPKGFQQKWFYFHSVNAPFCHCYPHLQYYRPAHFCFRYPWMLEAPVRKAYVSHTTPADGELESKLSYIDRRIEDKQYRPLLTRLSGHRVYGGRDNRKQHIYEGQIDLETRKVLQETETE